VTEPDWALLERSWAPARAAGVLGSATIEELADHAAGFLPAAWRVTEEFVGVDLGTGAGVPGLLLALRCPLSRWLLVDASRRRTELAAAAVAAVGCEDRVEVCHVRADDLARDPQWRSSADFVVARSFGPPAELAECGLPLVSPSGQLVVSVSEVTERQWRLGVSGLLPYVVRDAWTRPSGRYLAVAFEGELDDRFPRRTAARRRRPVF
jgi:16S rRNA (guanine527-N7)-methyltransferase